MSVDRDLDIAFRCGSSLSGIFGWKDHTTRKEMHCYKEHFRDIFTTL
jgi:hypothetical protein